MISQLDLIAGDTATPSTETPTHRTTAAPAFSFRNFQVEDFTRAAMHPGAIIALDPGGGKTLGMYSIAFMRKARRVLFVAPASLIEQIQDEGEEKLGIRPTLIANQADAYRLMREGRLPLPGTERPERSGAETPQHRNTEDPDFFITDYKWLGYNQADEVNPEDLDDEADDRPGPKLDRSYHIPEPHRTGIGEVRDGIRCVGSPSLSTLIADCFDCVCCDEGVRIKGGETTHIGRGVLQLNPANRYVFTGTPIKNRLTDIFYLLSWVCGYSPEPTPRWPFGRELTDRHEFARNHLVMEENESAYRRTGRRFVKQTARICNVHRLWKLLGPVVVRRRKDDMGDLVPKIFKPLHFQPGREQLDVYRHHVDNPPQKKSRLATLGAQLQALRTAAICPWSNRLGSAIGSARSGNSMTPKIAGILQLTADLLAKDEQLVVFSPFQEFATRLAGYYRGAGVPHAILDGRVKPQDRGSLAKHFKSRKLPVIICGIESMGEGHSFHMASNLVLPSLTWAWDKNAQAIDRVHRLISERPVSIYIMTTKGTIDERLLALFNEKGDSNDLALDGRLFENEREEVNLADLLRETLQDFDPSTTTIDEKELATSYRTGLQLRLQNLAEPWRKRAADTEPERPTRPHSKRPAPARPLVTIRAATVKPLDPASARRTIRQPQDREAIRRMLVAAFA